MGMDTYFLAAQIFITAHTFIYHVKSELSSSETGSEKTPLDKLFNSMVYFLHKIPNMHKGE
jgi:hypothetical protein